MTEQDLLSSRLTRREFFSFLALTTAIAAGLALSEKERRDLYQELFADPRLREAHRVQLQFINQLLDFNSGSLQIVFSGNNPPSSIVVTQKIISTYNYGGSYRRGDYTENGIILDWHELQAIWGEVAQLNLDNNFLIDTTLIKQLSPQDLGYQDAAAILSQYFDPQTTFIISSFCQFTSTPSEIRWQHGLNADGLSILGVPTDQGLEYNLHRNPPVIFYDQNGAHALILSPNDLEVLHQTALRNLTCSPR